MVQITMFKRVGWEVRITMLEVLGVVTTLGELIIYLDVVHGPFLVKACRALLGESGL
jgi:hypothetical protein